MRTYFYSGLLLIPILAFSQIDFLPVASFENELNPNFIEVSDIDSDNKPDVLVASEDHDFIIYATNESNFIPHKLKLKSTSNRRGIATGDFDGDGLIDIAVTEYNLDQVALFLASSSSVFNELTMIETGDGPIDIVTADYDQDGDLDLFCANSDGNSVTLLKNNGAGEFSIDQNIMVGSGPETIVAEDLNNDGFIDIVVTNKLAGSISIVFASGSGTFNSTQNISVEASPVELNISDLDDDGFKDIVVSHSGTNLISLLYGKSGNLFDVATENLGSMTVTEGIFAIADLDDNGNEDIAINGTGSTETVFLYNNGNRSYSHYEFSEFMSIQKRHDVIAANLFDNDQTKQLVFIGKESVVFNSPGKNASGDYNNYSEFSLTSSPQNFGLGDLNSDGYPDLAISNFTGSAYISLYLNDSGEGFQEPINVATANLGSPLSIAIDDMDNDGYADILTSHVNDVYIYYGDELHSYNSFESYSLDAWNIIIRDSNSDGNLDILSQEAIYLGNGERGFDLHSSVGGVNGQLGFALLDLNNDGHLDKVLQHQFEGIVEIYLGNPTGFANPTTLVLENASHIATGKFNNDDYDDLVITHYLAEGGFITNSFVSFIYGSTGGFELTNKIELSSLPSHIAAGDLNNDGYDEIALSIGLGVTLLIGEEDGSYSQLQEIDNGDKSTYIQITDFDNSGINDIVSSSRSTSGSTDAVRVIKTTGTAPIIKPNQEFEVIDNETVSLGIIEATDQDDMAVFSNWSIVGGNEEGIFILDETTGNLSIDKWELIDFESDPEYGLKVEVSNQNNRSRPAIVTVKFTNPLNVEPVDVLAIYPNPVRDRLTISYGSQPKDKMLRIKLFDTSGNLILSKSISSREAIDVSGVANGLYFLKIEDGSKLMSRKIIFR